MSDVVQELIETRQQLAAVTAENLTLCEANKAMVDREIPALRYELDQYRTALEEVSKTLPAFMDWAEIWHRQAGGYTASDTALVIMRMGKAAKLVAAAIAPSEPVTSRKGNMKRRMKPNPDLRETGYHSREHDEDPTCRKTHEGDTPCEPVKTCGECVHLKSVDCWPDTCDKRATDAMPFDPACPDFDHNEGAKEQERMKGGHA